MKDKITYCPETGKRQRSFTIDLTQDQETIDAEIAKVFKEMKGADDEG